MCSEHRIAALKLPYGVVFVSLLLQGWAMQVEIRLARERIHWKGAFLARRFVAARRRDGTTGASAKTY